MVHPGDRLVCTAHPDQQHNYILIPTIAAPKLVCCVRHQWQMQEQPLSLPNSLAVSTAMHGSSADVSISSDTSVVASNI